MPKLKSPKRKRRAAPQDVVPPTPLRVFLGWCVHFYTGLGAVAAGLIAVSLVHGGPAEFRWSFMLMLIATIIDSSDGTLARAVHIKEVIPSFDGRRLDDIIDFLTYTFLPLLLIWRAEILPAGFEPVLFLPLMASAYGFC
jgi:phosphatidylcholine synthase